MKRKQRSRVTPFGAEPAPASQSRDDLTVGVPLVKLVKRKLLPSSELVMLDRNNSVAAERFRRLKTVIANDPRQATDVLLVTSAGPNEGKSLISMNLALAFAADMQGEVLLIDSDMRRPSVGPLIQPPPKFGLCHLLSGKTGFDHAVIELDNSPLKILPAGVPSPDPVELLASPAAKNLMDMLKRRYQRIIIDTPPIGLFTDADVIGAHCDGAVMVARAGRTRTTLFERAVDSMTSTPIIGSVLNDAEFTLADRGNYHNYQAYYDYYGAGEEDS